MRFKGTFASSWETIDPATELEEIRSMPGVDPNLQPKEIICGRVLAMNTLPMKSPMQFCRFVSDAMDEAAPLVRDKPLNLGHFDPDAVGPGAQPAGRLYRGEVIATDDGPALVNRYYLVNDAAGQAIRLRQRAKVWGEVSPTLKHADTRCSICGVNWDGSRCEHRMGRVYNGRTCFALFGRITDYEELAMVADAQQNGTHYLSAARGESGDETAVFIARLAREQAGPPSLADVFGRRPKPLSLAEVWAQQK